MVELMNMQRGQQTGAATVILYLSAAICSGSGSRRKVGTGSGSQSVHLHERSDRWPG